MEKNTQVCFSNLIKWMWKLRHARRSWDCTMTSASFTLVSASCCAQESFLGIDSRFAICTSNLTGWGALKEFRCFSKCLTSTAVGFPLKIMSLSLGCNSDSILAVFFLVVIWYTHLCIDHWWIYECMCMYIYEETNESIFWFERKNMYACTYIYMCVICKYTM